MSYNRFPVLRTGTVFSQKTFINPEALTPSQKMLLTRNRIWGNIVGGNERTGFKELKKTWAPMGRGPNYYEHASIYMVFPWIKLWTKYNKAKLKYQSRKKRIFMRGIKIGTKRKDTSTSSMGMFEMMKKQKQPDIPDHI